MTHSAQMRALSVILVSLSVGCDLFHTTDWANRCEADPSACASSGGGGAGGTSSSSISVGGGGEGAVGAGGRGGSVSVGGGGRDDGHVTDGLLSLYTFEEGGGRTVTDVSGAGAALDLTIADTGAVEWIAGGLRVAQSTIIASAGPATKIIAGCQQTSEITLEVWFVPANLTQAGPARMITNSADASVRNFLLGQEASSYYQARLRSTSSDENGFPIVQTPTGEGDVAVVLTHLLYSRDASGNRRIYVDGVERNTNILGGDFSNWDPTFRLALANEFTFDRTWLGELYRVAVYGRALTPAEVLQNFQAGP